MSFQDIVTLAVSAFAIGGMVFLKLRKSDTIINNYAPHASANASAPSTSDSSGGGLISVGTVVKLIAGIAIVGIVIAVASMLITAVNQAASDISHQFSRLTEPRPEQIVVSTPIALPTSIAIPTTTSPRPDNGAMGLLLAIVGTIFLLVILLITGRDISNSEQPVLERDINLPEQEPLPPIFVRAIEEAEARKR